jgi:hypothetical protein
MTDGSLRHQQRVETVACLGSSTTASRGTYKWIDELQMIQRRNLDEIAQINGWQFHIDAFTSTPRAVASSRTPFSDSWTAETHAQFSG